MTKAIERLEEWVSESLNSRTWSITRYGSGEYSVALFDGYDVKNPLLVHGCDFHMADAISKALDSEMKYRKKSVDKTPAIRAFDLEPMTTTWSAGSCL